jgi:two-component system sensor histidine kinase YesM
LSKFYRLSLSGGEDTVRVRDELEHVQAYVQIQNMRYADCIRLILNVPEPLLYCPILKLVIQPLVENAIFHGIMHKPDENGVIEINGEIQNEALCLHVRDDGVGMPEERAHNILSAHPPTENHHGYGVRNIDERLRLRYGTGFGLSFRSIPGEGTTVTVRIPAAYHASSLNKSMDSR